MGMGMGRGIAPWLGRRVAAWLAPHLQADSFPPPTDERMLGWGRKEGCSNSWRYVESAII